MKIDVLIPSRELPIISIMGLIQQTRKPDNVIIWTDKIGNSDAKNQLGYLSKITNLKIIVEQSKNIGQKRKEFISKTESDFVWLLDDDAFPMYDCLENFENKIEKNEDFYQGMCIEPPGVVFKGEKEWDIITGNREPERTLSQGDTKNMFCKTNSLRRIIENDKKIDKLKMFEHTYLSKKMEKLIFVPNAKVMHMPSKDSFVRSSDFYLNAKKIIDLL